MPEAEVEMVVDPAASPEVTPPVAPAPVDSETAGALKRLSAENREFKAQLERIRTERATPPPPTETPEQRTARLTETFKDPVALDAYIREQVEKGVQPLTVAQEEREVGRLLNGHPDAKHPEFVERFDALFKDAFPKAFQEGRLPTAHETRVLLKLYNAEHGTKSRDTIKEPPAAPGAGGAAPAGKMTDEDIAANMQKATLLMSNPKTYVEGKALKAKTYAAAGIVEDEE